MGKQPIGVFDSGVGGLSVLKELHKILPNEDFIFLADQLYVPYGEKTKKELINLGHRVVDYFIKKHDVKMVVVACNTSTCYSIDALRQGLTLSIVGTVPAIKPASERTKTGTIGIISTPATSKSPAVKNLIRDYCKGVKVINIGCKNLENAVENGNLNDNKVKKLLKKYLEKIKNTDVDYLVLGCTHYPFLKEPIRKILGSKVKLIDGGTAIAKRTASLLKTHKIINKNKNKGRTQYFTTGNPKKFSKVAGKLLNTKILANRVKI
ncbi:MAG TPA: glutamate racemase [Candidatus Paceibacterota bacterium]